MTLNTIGDPKCKYMNKHPKLSLTESDSNISNQVKEPKCHKNAKITCFNAYKKPECKLR